MMIIFIENPKDVKKYYQIEYHAIDSGDTISIYREDGEGMDIDQNDIYEMIHDWFKKRML